MNIRRVAAILGYFNSFVRNFNHGRPGENGYVVEYRQDESATLAADFAVEGIRFSVKNEAAQLLKRSALLRKEYNSEVQEEDREFSAVVSAGTKYGSLTMLRAIQEEEKVLKEKLAVGPHKVRSWLSNQHEGGGESEHDEGDTPPTSPHASSDQSSMETESLTPNRATRSPVPTNEFVPTPYEEIGLSPPMDCPGGLHATHGHITEKEESSLLEFLSEQQWTKVGKWREECQYGYGYVHGERRVRKLGAIPDVLMSVANTLTGSRESREPPNQVIALRYTPPYELPAHKDAHVFDDVIHTLCLGSDVVLTFHDGEKRYDLVHRRRALVTMGGYSRYECTHSILPGTTDTIEGEVVKRGVRFALTFRRVVDSNLPPSPALDE